MKAWLTGFEFHRWPIAVVCKAAMEADVFQNWLTSQVGRDFVPCAPIACELVRVAAGEPSHHALVLRDYMESALTSATSTEEIHQTIEAFMEAYHQERAKEDQAATIKKFMRMGVLGRGYRD
jgi:hypothetical protein